MRESSIPPESALRSHSWRSQQAVGQRVSALGALPENPLLSAERANKRQKLRNLDVVDDSLDEHDADAERERWLGGDAGGDESADDDDDHNRTHGEHSFQRVYSPELGERIRPASAGARPTRSAEIEITGSSQLPPGNLNGGHFEPQVKSEVPSPTYSQGEQSFLDSSTRPRPRYCPSPAPTIRRSKANSSFTSSASRGSGLRRRKDVYEMPSTDEDAAVTPRAPGSRPPRTKSSATPANRNGHPSPSERASPRSSERPGTRDLELRKVATQKVAEGRVENETRQKHDDGLREDEERREKEQLANKIREEEERNTIAREQKTQLDVLEKEEAERLNNEEAEKLAKEEAARLAKEEAARLAKEEAVKLAKEEAARLAKAEAARLEKEGAEKLAKEEETARLAKENADKLILEKKREEEAAEVRRLEAEAEASRIAAEAKRLKIEATKEKRRQNREQKMMEAAAQKLEQDKARKAQEQQEKEAEAARKLEEESAAKAKEQKKHEEDAARKLEEENVRKAKEQQAKEKASKAKKLEPLVSKKRSRRDSSIDIQNPPATNGIKKLRIGSPSGSDSLSKASPVAEQDMGPPPIPNSAMKRSNLKKDASIEPPNTKKKNSVSFVEENPTPPAGPSMISTPAPATRATPAKRTPIHCPLPDLSTDMAVNGTLNTPTQASKVTGGPVPKKMLQSSSEPESESGSEESGSEESGSEESGSRLRLGLG